VTERVFRVRRDRGFAEYRVPVSGRTTVLDGLLHIHRYLDRTLAFRFACRQAMCGTCGVRVNGVERLACSTLVSAVPGSTVVVEPLRNLPVLRDLVVDFGPFFRAWKAVSPQFVPSPGLEGPLVLRPSSAAREEIERHRECISCGLCYSACDVVARNAEFLGPAALTRAYCLVLDIRDRRRHERLREAGSLRGCLGCHTLMACSEVCPKGLRPALAIQGLRRHLVWKELPRGPVPDGA
jgi:fumarate reductase iron-sulfur subunit